MMHKKVKMPEVAMKESFDLSKNKKLLKKVIVIEPFQGPYKYLYDADFEYADRNEEVPQAFLFIGEDLPSNWKKYIKTRKASKTLSAGECLLDEKGNLRLVSKVGKGDKSKVLLQVNKQLLKPFSKAYFVNDLSEGMAENTTDENNNDDTVASASPVAQLSSQVTEINQQFTAIQAEHDAEDIEDLLVQIQEWKSGFQQLSGEERAQIKSFAETVLKQEKQLEQIKTADEQIDKYFQKVMGLIDDYIAMPDHSTAEAKALKVKTEKNIKKLETAAAKINDNDFIEACQRFRTLLNE